MIAWSIELSEFGIKYQPRGASKAHVLADFIAKVIPEELIPIDEDVWTCMWMRSPMKKEAI